MLMISESLSFAQTNSQPFQHRKKALWVADAGDSCTALESA